MKLNPLIIAAAAGLTALAASAQVTTSAGPAPEARAGAAAGSGSILGSINSAAAQSYYAAADAAKAFSFGWGGAREAESPVSVVEFNSPDQRTVDETGEDLRIMSLLFAHKLEKASANDSPVYKLGIPLLLMGQEHAVQASYIEGVGAVFSLKVRFPLIAPTVEETNASPVQKESAWTRAQQELSGEADKNPPAEVFAMNQESTQAYQSNVVETIKTQVIETLAEASNFRHLAPNESIMVTITGVPNDSLPSRSLARNSSSGSGTSSGGGSSSSSTSDPAAAPTFAEAYAKNHSSWSPPLPQFKGPVPDFSAPRRATMITIRIKQSDALALAQNKMTREEFIKAAQVTTYLGPASHSPSGALRERRAVRTTF